MFDNIRSYFVRDVLANYEAYRKSIEEKETGVNNDLRLAINSATSLFHMREHMPYQIKKSRSQVAKLCPSFDLLGDIVNASKHKKLTQGKPKLKSAEKIEEIIVITEYEDEAGKYYDSEKKIQAHLDDGRTIDIDEILLDVINFWIEEMGKLGYSFKKIKPIVKEIPPSRSSDSGAAPLNLKLIKGEDFKLKAQFKTYDKKTGTFTPKDLSGFKFRMNIYKPKFEGVLTITNNETVKEHQVSIPLTTEQYEKLNEIEDPEIKNMYLNKLLRESEDVQQKLREIFGK